MAVEPGLKSLGSKQPLMRMIALSLTFGTAI
jgi:hypothetical protein